MEKEEMTEKSRGRQIEKCKENGKQKRGDEMEEENAFFLCYIPVKRKENGKEEETTRGNWKKGM